MRKLILLQGAPGVGKTTALEKAGLSSLALSYDAFRQLMFPTTYAFDGEVSFIGYEGQGQVEKIVGQSAEYKMKEGQTIIVDGTAASRRFINTWKSLATRYGYDTYIVDMQKNVSLSETKRRNAQREFARVPDEVVEDAYMRYLEQGRDYEPSIPRLTLDEVNDMLTIPVCNLDAYDEVITVGDVQSCGLSLLELLDKVEEREAIKRFWIFVGDLFDRGQHPIEVIQAIRRIPEKDRVIIEGNHERNLHRELRGIKTVPASIETAQVLRTVRGGKGSKYYKEALNLVHNSQPFYTFTFHGKEYWASHAGIMPAMMDKVKTENGYKVGLISNVAFFFGAGERSKGYQGRGDYSSQVFEKLEEASAQAGQIQYFGHRNAGIAPLEKKFIRPLESNVEFGGKLTAIALTRQGEELIQVEGEKRTTTTHSNRPKPAPEFLATLAGG